MEIIEPLRPHLHGQPQFPEHRAGVRDHDGAVLGPAFEPGPGRKQSRNDCGQQCNQESCYRAAVSRQKAVCGNYHQEAAIHKLLRSETAAAGVFVTALSISMTSTFCGQSWLRAPTRGHVDILSVIRDNFFAEAEQ